MVLRPPPLNLNPDNPMKKTLPALVFVLSSLAVSANEYRVRSVDGLLEALQYVAWEAFDGEPGTIRVAAGTYKIYEPLKVYPGTTLLLDDGAVVKYVGSTDRDCLVRGYHFDEDGQSCLFDDNCPHRGYTQCHDVVIRGGVWDRNCSASDNGSGFVFRHASGIVLRDLTIRKCSNHYFNLSGSENILVEGVTFQDPVKYSGRDDEFWGKFAKGDDDRYKTLEAIHLDALTKTGEPTAKPLDGTPCRNVTVSRCVFDRVFAGVGTHHVAEGKPGEGIQVVECSFSNLQSFALYCFGYEDFLAENNTVVGGAGLASVEDSSCTLVGNTATGGHHNTIQIGNGSTATISGNTLRNAGMAAVRGLGGSDLTVENNEISAPATMGLSVAEGSHITASGNRIVGAKQHGVYANAATADLSGNTIESPKEAGIRGDLKATVVADGNVIANAGTYGITMSGSSKLVATGNDIRSPAKYGIILDACAPGTVSGNVVSSAGSVGIRLNGTKGTKVTGNTVKGTASGCDGILLDGCATGTVSKNKVSKTGGFGIRVLGSKAVPATVAVTGNTVSTGAAAKGYADIRLGDYSRKCQVKENLLGNGIYTVSSTGTSGNVYAPAGTELVSLVRTTKAKMSAKWKKQKYALGYQLQWADNKKFKKAKTATVGKAKTVTKTISKLAAKKRYWVRVRTFDKLSGKECFSAWSPAFTALPSWAAGTFSGHVVAGGVPGTATMTVANTGAVSGSFLVNGSVAAFSAADLASWNGKAFTVKFAVKIGSKTWKPTCKIAPAAGALEIGTAKMSASGLSAELAQNLSLLSKSGKLSKLVGKKVSFSSAAAGLPASGTLSVSFANGDAVSWKATLGGRSVSGTAPCVAGSAKASGKSVVYTAKIPVCIPAVGYNRLLVCKITRAKSGACKAKWTFANF